MDVKKLLSKKEVLVASAFIAGIVVTLLIIHTSSNRIPLDAYMGNMMDAEENERYVNLSDGESSTGDASFIKNKWNAYSTLAYIRRSTDERYESNADYIFRNVEGGTYSVWATFPKPYAYYAASKLPITIYNGANTPKRYLVNYKEHVDISSEVNVLVPIGDTINVQDGDTVKISVYSADEGEGSWAIVIGNMMIRRSEGGEGEGEDTSYCGDGITNPDGSDNMPGTEDDEQCDDMQNGDSSDGCSDLCKELARHDKIQYTATTWETSDGSNSNTFDLNFTFILWNPNPFPGEDFPISIEDPDYGFYEEVLTDVSAGNTSNIEYTVKNLQRNQKYTMGISTHDQVRQTFDIYITDCGDGVRDPDGPDNTPGTSDDEECDDGNQDNDDSCTDTCHECGNYVLSEGEKCVKDKVFSLFDLNEDGKKSFYEPPILIQNLIIMMQNAFAREESSKLDSKYDVNFDGQVSPLDTLVLIDLKDFDAEVERLEELFSTVDANQNNAISPMECLYAEQKIQEGNYSYDLNGDGTVDGGDENSIREVATDFAYDNDVEHLRNAFSVDRNHDGYITLEDADETVLQIMYIVNQPTYERGYDSTLDVDGNGILEPHDVLMLINARNEYMSISNTR